MFLDEEELLIPNNDTRLDSDPFDDYENVEVSSKKSHVITDDLNEDPEIGEISQQQLYNDVPSSVNPQQDISNNDEDDLDSTLLDEDYLGLWLNN